MQESKVVYKGAWPYQNDKMNLPVENVRDAIPFYEKIMGFKVQSISASPIPTAILSRDEIQIAIAENGGDPTQEGCFFEVNNVQAALEEIRLNGMKKEQSEINMENHGGVVWKVFYVVAPDGLCYCLGERES